MKKLLILALLLQTFTLAAENVSLETARKIAISFLQKKGIVTTPKHSLKAIKRSQSPSSARGSGEAYHIFDAGNDKGFVIVSGDDRTTPVLGYTRKGHYDESKVSPEFRAWLDEYARQIQALRPTTKGATVSSGTRSTTLDEVTKYAIAPLLESRWNQRAPYNNRCPQLPNGKKTVTGCLATAVAQVMYYHQWPEKTKTEIPAYTTDTKKLNMPAIAAESVIDWGNMRPVYPENATTEGGNAVADLMYYCGSALKMDYDLSSGAYSSSAPHVLQTYFDYSNTTRIEYRKNHTSKSWENTIYQELSEGRPIVYSGQSGGGGHSFVCDGYDGDGFYHINWGWGGVADGYFQLSVMNPGNNSGAGASSTADGYAGNQDIVIGIKPRTEGEPTPQYAPTAENFAVTGTTGSYRICNYNPVRINFSCQMAYVNAEGGLTRIGSVSNGALNGMVSGRFSYFSGQIDFQGKITTPGTYRAIPVAWLQGQGPTEAIATSSSDRQYFEVVVGSDGRVTSVKAHPLTDVTITNIATTQPAVVNKKTTVRVTMRNNTADEYQSRLFFFASKTTTPGAPKENTYVQMGGNEEATIDFAFQPTETGTYNISIATDRAGNQIVGSGSINVLQTLQEVSAPRIVSWNLPVGNGGTLYRQQFKGSVSVKNEGTAPYNAPLTIHLYEPSLTPGYISVQQKVTKLPTIAPGETVDVEFEFRQTGYQELSLYAYFNENQQDPSSFYFTTQRGTTYYKGGEEESVAPGTSFNTEEDMTAVVFEGSAPQQVTPNGNPNTLYYFESGATVPGQLDNKNVVVGDRAANITIEHGRDFSPVKDFNAQNILYKRRIGNGTSGRGGWETMALPFVPTDITTEEGNALTWIKERGGAGDFYLKEFAGVSDDLRVLFKFTSELRANTPYIVAFPGARFGNRSLAGKTLVFKAQESKIKADASIIGHTSSYKFVGTTKTENVADAYVLNAEGTVFERNATAQTMPFAAYFTADSNVMGSSQRLYIGSFENNITGLDEPLFQKQKEGTKAVYDLTGRRVSTMSRHGNGTIDHLPKGLYIIGGKKVFR